MAYNDETQTEWCERTWRDVWDGEMVVRWEVETRTAYAKWVKHETITRDHVKTAQELEHAIERSCSNAEGGSKVRVLAWVASYTRRQITTRTWTTTTGDDDDRVVGSATDSPLVLHLINLMLQGREVGITTILQVNEDLRKENRRLNDEIDRLRNWKLETIAMVEDLRDRSAERKIEAESAASRGRMFETVVNTAGAKLLGSTTDDEGKKQQITTLLGSALGDFGKSLTDEQRQTIADTLTPEQQLAFYLALLPEEGGHERLQELQEQKQKALPSPELLTRAKSTLPPEDYTSLVTILKKVGKNDV